MKVNKEFIDKNFSTIHLSFLQTIVFRQSFINHNLGGAVDSCIIQIVCWHHLTSLLNDNLKNEIKRSDNEKTRIRMAGWISARTNDEEQS